MILLKYKVNNTEKFSNMLIEKKSSTSYLTKHKFKPITYKPKVKVKVNRYQISQINFIISSLNEFIFIFIIICIH